MLQSFLLHGPHSLLPISIMRLSPFTSKNGSEDLYVSRCSGKAVLYIEGRSYVTHLRFLGDLSDSWLFWEPSCGTITVGGFPTSSPEWLVWGCGLSQAPCKERKHQAVCPLPCQPLVPGKEGFSLAHIPGGTVSANTSHRYFSVNTAVPHEFCQTSHTSTHTHSHPDTHIHTFSYRHTPHP